MFHDFGKAPFRLSTKYKRAKSMPSIFLSITLSLSSKQSFNFSMVSNPTLNAKIISDIHYIPHSYIIPVTTITFAFQRHYSTSFQ